MDPGDVYHYIAGNDLTFNFGGVLPSHGLPLLNGHGLTLLFGKCFLIFIPNDPSPDGHYVALVCHHDHFELFDPMGYPSIVDNYMANFMSNTLCVINTMPCQSPNLDCCGLYCIYYLYLRFLGFDSSDIMIVLSGCSVYALHLLYHI